MVKDSNKIPDPEFESLGLQGWECFFKEFQDIRKDFCRYGEIALQTRLGKSIEIYKDVFMGMNFYEALHKIWTERYHYVADNYEELIAFWELANKKNIPWNSFLLPNACPDKRGEIDGRDQVFALSRKLYGSIVQYLKNNNILFLLKENKLYELTLKEERDTDSFYKIEMKEVNVIKVE